MSHFYAAIPTSARRTVATARGHKQTGIAVEACSWAGKVRTYFWYDEATGKDMFEVWQGTHQGEGVSQLLATGIVGEPCDSAETTKERESKYLGNHLHDRVL